MEILTTVIPDLANPCRKILKCFLYFFFDLADNFIKSDKLD